MSGLLADKRFAYALIVIGVVAALLSILIDPLRGLNLYLAPVQIIVLIVSLIVIVAGIYLAFVRKPPAT
jgi:hypothetical protein